MSTEKPGESEDLRELETVRASAAESQQDTASETIGNYRILQKLGEGGMGEVYSAEQTHPVRRKVALKVIKLGM